MKHNTKVVQALGEKNMSQVLRIALIAVAALFMTSALAQSFNGFASYQAYLNNYYAQNQQNRAVTFTPAPTIQTTPYTTTTNAYNGFASYQDYLDNFYAGQNVPSPAVDPCGFAQTLSIFVSANDNCAPRTTTPTYTNSTTAFNGYPSYQAYLDAFYAGNVSTTTTPPATNTNNSVTSGYYGYNSYEEYLQAFYAVNNTAPPRTETPAPSTPAPSTSVSGYFDFNVGQAYQFSNGLIMTVETLNDNRCPQGVQCVWQGDIAATVRLAMGNDIRNITVSIVEGRQAPQVVVDDASVQFVGLGERVNNANTLSTYIVMN